MKVFRVLENNKVEYGEFSGKYNTIVWKDISLVDTYITQETIDGEVVEKIVYPLFVKLENDRFVPDLVAIQAESDAQALADWKASRAEAVANIKVTTLSGNEFDGDEVSQGRMSRAISVMADTDTTIWVLANNVPTEVSKAELIEALKLSGEAQTALWVYE